MMGSTRAHPLARADPRPPLAGPLTPAHPSPARSPPPTPLARLLARVLVGADPNKYVIEEDAEEEVPFACLICRKDFTNPITTRCGHYFCEKCALDQYRKTPKCFVCGEKTGGLFNTAKELLRKLEERKRRMKEDSRGGLDDVPASGGDSEAATSTTTEPVSTT